MSYVHLTNATWHVFRRPLCDRASPRLSHHPINFDNVYIDTILRNSGTILVNQSSSCPRASAPAAAEPCVLPLINKRLSSWLNGSIYPQCRCQCHINYSDHILSTKSYLDDITTRTCILFLNFLSQRHYASCSSCHRTKISVIMWLRFHGTQC